MENGVGMLRLLDTEVSECLVECKGDDRARKLTIATGRLAATSIKEQIAKIQKKYPNVSAEVVAVRNDFFGEQITVAGLVTGGDLISQLKDRELGDVLLLPEVMLRSGEDVFLDDLTVSDVEKALQTRVSIVKSEGESFVQAVIE